MRIRLLRLDAKAAAQRHDNLQWLEVVRVLADHDIARSRRILADMLARGARASTVRERLVAAARGIFKLKGLWDARELDCVGMSYVSS